MKPTIMNKGLYNTRLFKKASYKILKKLHKLEKKKYFKRVHKIGNNIAIILSLQALIKILKLFCSNKHYSKNKMLKLINSLSKLCVMSQKNGYMDRKLLVSCLKQHTNIFNDLIINKIEFSISQEIFFLWNIKCLPLYINQFGNKF